MCKLHKIDKNLHQTAPSTHYTAHLIMPKPLNFQFLS